MNRTCHVSSLLHPCESVVYCRCIDRMAASAVAIMAVHDPSAKLHQPHTIQRLLRASSTGNAANLVAAMGSSSLSLASSSGSAFVSPSPSTSTTMTSLSGSTSAALSVSSPPYSVPLSSSSPSSSSSSPSSSNPSSPRSRPVSLRSRFSPGHIRISIASRHAALHDSAARIKEEEDEAREERKNNEEEEQQQQREEQSFNKATNVAAAAAGRPLTNHSFHAPASSSSSFSSASSSSSVLPVTRSRLQLSQLRPSIHTAGRDAPRKGSLLSASPAITPSSTSPRSSFLPTTRPHAHSLSFSSNRLTQHPEDAHHASAQSSSSSALHSRRNSLSRYNPIGNEEQRGRDMDDGSGVLSARSPHLFSPTASGSPTAAAAAALSLTAAARPTNAGSWRHRRPQCLTAPFSSNAIIATTVTASALSSVGSSAQLSSAQSVSPSAHAVAAPSANSSASHTPMSSTSSPPSSSSTHLPPSLSASASFTYFTQSAASRIASPLMTSLSPSLISALIHVNEPPHSHHSHSHTAHSHNTLPPAETIQEETPSPRPAQLTRSSGKEHTNDRAARTQKVVKKKERREVKRREESKAEMKVAEERKESITPTYLPVPQRTASMPTPLAHSPPPRSPPTPQFVPPLPAPPRLLVPAASPPLPVAAAPAPCAPVSYFGPLLPADELSGGGHPPIRVAMRGRSAGSIVLVAAGGESAAAAADEADRVEDAVNGRRGSSVPVSHHRDWASLTAIQHMRHR